MGETMVISALHDSLEQDLWKRFIIELENMWSQNMERDVDR